MARSEESRHDGVLFECELTGMFFIMILNICSIYVILYLCNRTESGCDFPIVRCPLVLQRRVMPMNTMEVLTLLLVVFTALSYIDRHGDDNNKKK